MAYANSVMFYGWLQEEALETINYILPDKKFKSFEHVLEEENIEKLINNKINNNKVILKLGTFDAGLSSDDAYNYLYFGMIKESQSCSDDDISKNSFSLEELKQFIDMSFAIKKITNYNNKPKMYNLVVSDSK